MAKKRRKRAQQRSPLERFFRNRRRWGRRLGVLAGLAAVAIALWFIADPLGGGFTAIDENGIEVRAGTIDGAENASARRGSPAPNFLLPDFERQAVRLDQFQGKVVLVNFWAAWCEFCDAEMPDMLRIAREFPDDVVVLALNRGESKGTATTWVRNRNFPEDLPNFHWLLDDRESVTRTYRVDGMPQSFFIDGNGIIRREMRRVMEYDDMLESVERALAFNTSSRSSE